MFLADTNIFLEIFLKQNKGEDCKRFLNDNIGNLNITDFSLHYKEIVNAKKNLNLDFDDAYQYNIAKFYSLKVVTMDKDFERIKDVDILFL